MLNSRAALRLCLVALDDRDESHMSCLVPQQHPGRASAECQGESRLAARTIVGSTGVTSLAAPAMLISATGFGRAFFACRFNRTCYEFSAGGKIGLPIRAHLGSSFTCVRASCSPFSSWLPVCGIRGISRESRLTGIKKPRSDKRSNFPGRRKGEERPEETNLYYLASLLSPGVPASKRAVRGSGSSALVCLRASG